LGAAVKVYPSIDFAFGGWKPTRMFGLLKTPTVVVFVEVSPRWGFWDWVCALVIGRVKTHPYSGVATPWLAEVVSSTFWLPTAFGPAMCLHGKPFWCTENCLPAHRRHLAQWKRNCTPVARAVA
jgi:hypothetical protein